MLLLREEIVARNLIEKVAGVTWNVQNSCGFDGDVFQFERIENLHSDLVFKRKIPILSYFLKGVSDSFNLS